jgi:NAD-dependent SIR2 family protein deacetylase
MKTAIFLGAGASKIEGAPIQNDLFKEYFKSLGSLSAAALEGTQGEMKKELLDFFHIMFDIDVRTLDPNVATFPTFEEALGLLDLAELRREAFKEYELEDFGPKGNRLRTVRKYLVFAMAKVIDDTLKNAIVTGTKGQHQKLVEELDTKGLLQDTVFVTTNYDILIDNAISSRSMNAPGENLDYGVEFTNFRRNDWPKWNRPGPHAVGLYKLHGSLNWLYCANDNTLTLTPYEKGVTDLITDAPIANDRAICRDCGSVMSPIIVPPTFYKDMSRVFLGEIWNKAEQALRQVEQIIFCGYSFPDADMHIKYLLKRVQANRPNPKRLRFTVVNHHADKSPQQADEEERRYHRFLGDKVVDYKTSSGFEEFVQTPERFYVTS